MISPERLHDFFLVSSICWGFLAVWVQIWGEIRKLERREDFEEWQEGWARLFRKLQERVDDDLAGFSPSPAVRAAFTEKRRLAVDEETGRVIASIDWSKHRFLCGPAVWNETLKTDEIRCSLCSLPAPAKIHREDA